MSVAVSAVSGDQSAPPEHAVNADMLMFILEDGTKKNIGFQKYRLKEY